MSSRTPKGQRSGSGPAKVGTSTPSRSPARSSVSSRPVSSARTAGGRQSVASAREMSASANRTQLIIGAIAVGLIAVIVVVGLVLNKKQNASPVTDHPVSTNSTASVSDGVITVTGVGASPAVTIDMYEDGICPVCRDFEGQFGQQMKKGVDEGKLAIRYHFLDFLNLNSASKNYSTRAAAALACVAAVPTAEAPKGLFLNFHTTVFSAGVQPVEGSGADLSNAQLAALATKAGAPASAASCINAGAGLAAAQTAAKADEAALTQAIGSNWGTPTVLLDGKPVGINTTDWLTKLIG